MATPPLLGSPARSNGRQPPFEGSFRQVRGAVIAALRERQVLTLGSLAVATGYETNRVAAAVAALAGEGMVSAGPAALAGRPGGRVRLGRD